MAETESEGRPARDQTDAPGSGRERDATRGASRKQFVGLVGGAGGAAALSTLLAACGGEEEEQEVQPRTGPEGTAAGDPGTDLEILNYVLFLEYLEQDLYEQALKSGELGDPQLQRLAKEILGNETEHVNLLEGVVQQLGGQPVARPGTTFDSVIQGGEAEILEVAATLENLGAAAYLGQAPRIENGRVLEAVLSIHTVEGRHAAALNELAGLGSTDGKLKGSLPDGAFAEPMSREQVLRAAAPFVKE
jgi:rubrerythrin